jgi:hypothetical protein
MYDEWDARDQFWDDIEREYEADCEEYSEYDDHDLSPEELAEENGGLYDDFPF